MTAILFLLRAIILVLLWAFVLAAIVSVRQDIFGTRKAARRPATPRPTPAPAPRPAAAAAPAGRRDRGAPRKLVVTGGTLQGTTVPLTDVPITIGRADDPTLVLTDDYISTRPSRPAPGRAHHDRPRRRLDAGPHRRLRLDAACSPRAAR